MTEVRCPACGRMMMLWLGGLIFPHQSDRMDDETDHWVMPDGTVEPPFVSPACPGSNVAPTRH